MRPALLLLSTMSLMLLLVAGVALAATISCQDDVDCFGTKNPDTLNGSSTGDDRMFGRGDSDTLNGLHGNNHLYGQGGNDNLFGGLNGDKIAGGSGRDALSGGGAIDHFFFGPRWGKDTIIDDGTSANALFFQKSFSEPVLVAQDLTITLTPGAGPEVKNNRGTTTINWEGNVIGTVYSGAGDDQITGNDLANHLVDDEGTDTIFGRGGDDLINVADGTGGDSVDCGEDLIGGADDDQVTYDSGDDISDNCETKVVSQL